MPLCHASNFRMRIKLELSQLLHLPLLEYVSTEDASWLSVLKFMEKKCQQ